MVDDIEIQILMELYTFSDYWLKSDFTPKE